MSSPEDSPKSSPLSLARSVEAHVKQVGNYFLTKTLGEGAFSKVKLGIHCETEQQYAIKIMKKDRLIKEGLIDQVKKEIAIMKLVQHPNIVRLYEVLSSSSKLYLVLELITGGEIFWRVIAEKKFSEHTARMYFQQLIDGVNYCHSYGIFHRDLKPENLLLDDRGDLRITDFGLSTTVRPFRESEAPLSPVQRQKAESTLLYTRCGTLQYAAPEVLKGGGYSGAAADVWGCGVILYVFLTGVLPFEDQMEAELMRKISKVAIAFPSHLSSGALDLLKKIFVANPKKRITLKHIKNHPWILEEPYVPSKGVPIDTTALQQVSVSPNASFGTPVEESNVSDSKSINPSSMNAFDLISRAGTFDLTRLIRDSNARGYKTQHATQFTTRNPVPEVVELLKSVLDEMPFIGYSFNEKKLHFHVTGRALGKGLLLFEIHLLKITEKTHLVSFERRRGSVLDFWKVYHTIISQCSHITCLDSL